MKLYRKAKCREPPWNSFIFIQRKKKKIDGEFMNAENRFSARSVTLWANRRRNSHICYYLADFSWKIRFLYRRAVWSVTFADEFHCANSTKQKNRSHPSQSHWFWIGKIEEVKTRKKQQHKKKLCVIIIVAIQTHTHGFIKSFDVFTDEHARDHACHIQRASSLLPAPNGKCLSYQKSYRNRVFT